MTGGPCTLWTAGHGALPLEALVAGLRREGIRQVVDLRRRPASRRHPWLCRAPLARALEAAGLAYRWEGEALGGLRGRLLQAPPGLEGLEPAWWGFAAHMGSPAFREAVGRLLALARRAPTALLCAETDPGRCHRALVADHLVLVEGCRVLHLLPGGAREHRPHPAARARAGRLLYPGQAALPL